MSNANAGIVSTSNQWPNYAVGNSANPGSKGSSSVMGKDQFLKILITQLQNQDPMQPMQDKEFIAQMAQFTSVEQLMNISTQLTAMNQSLGAASSLIGKEIGWTDAATKTAQSGLVDSIIVKDGAQYAVVGNERIALKDVTEVRNTEAKGQAEGGKQS